MLRRIAFALTFLIGTAGQSALATTVNLVDTITFGGGPFSGASVVYDITYQAPAPGVLVLDLPDVTASVSFLGITSSAPTYALLVFSGSLDPLNPEVYLDFSVDPTTNPQGISYIGRFISEVGLFGPSFPDLLLSSDYPGATFSRITTVVPLPASGLMLLAGALGLAAMRRRRRSAAV